MRKLLLNSAVIPAGNYGKYSYEPATKEELERFCLEGPFPESHIGYDETAQKIAAWTNCLPPISRTVAYLAVGDVAFVVRLKYRVSPSLKGIPLDTQDEDWEIGRLTRIE
jgi:hypothetical protein